VNPGGVVNQRELREALTRDSVVATHYRAVSVADVQVKHLTEDRLAYVSYRIGDKIYWTKKPLRLRRGEAILTDGVTEIRSRCGNCLSLEPLLPTSDEEPTPFEFEALLNDPTDQVPPIPLIPSAPLQLTPVPEPGTLFLLGGGAGALALRRYARWRRRPAEAQNKQSPDL
jgi:hypothetical protein